MAILRIVASLMLGFVIFASLLCYLLLVNISQRLDDSEVYKDAIDDTNAYNRIYDEVLVDEAFKEQTVNLLGGVEVSGDETVEILKTVMPPAYLREQTEENIDRFTAFLQGEIEKLDIYIELEEPLNRVEPVVLERIHKTLDGLEIEELGPPACSVESLQRLNSNFAETFSDLASGGTPESVVSLKTLTRECREMGYDAWFSDLVNSPEIDSQVSRILDGEKQQLRQSFVAGDTREFLKNAATPLVIPVIDDALREIRGDLQANDRLDLLQNLAGSADDLSRGDIDELADDLSREDIDELADSLRGVVGAVNGQVRVTALLLIIVGCVLLAAVHFPRPRAMLLWPGLSLLFSGGVCLIVGFVLNSVIPGGIRNVVADPASYSPDISTSPDVSTAAIGLAGDLLESFARQVTPGIIPAAVAVTVLGGVLVVASLFADVFWSAIRRLLPESRDERSR